MNKIKQKGVSAIIALLAAVVSLVGLVMYAMYIGNGGSMNLFVVAALIAGILLELSLIVLNGDIADAAAILAPVLIMTGAGLEIGDGIGNLTDWISGVICFGNPDLAESNISITVVLVIGVLIAIVGCFMSKEARKQKN